MRIIMVACDVFGIAKCISQNIANVARLGSLQPVKGRRNKLRKTAKYVVVNDIFCATRSLMQQYVNTTCFVQRMGIELNNIFCAMKSLP